jgi:isocitrate dehydrogenase (NAD+)
MSDLTAGLVGGLGMAPGANIGVDAAIFEAVHGTAPDIAGKGLANPTALMLSAALMLDYVHQDEAAARLRTGVRAALRDDDARTKDAGGRGNTKTFTEKVISSMS